jgi:hypothetical protein
MENAQVHMGEGDFWVVKVQRRMVMVAAAISLVTTAITTLFVSRIMARRRL